MKLAVSPGLTFLPPPPDEPSTASSARARLSDRDRRDLKLLSIFSGEQPAEVVSRLLRKEVRRLTLPCRLRTTGPP